MEDGFHGAGNLPTRHNAAEYGLCATITMQILNIKEVTSPTIVHLGPITNPRNISERRRQLVCIPASLAGDGDQ